MSNFDHFARIYLNPAKNGSLPVPFLFISPQMYWKGDPKKQIIQRLLYISSLTPVSFAFWLEVPLSLFVLCQILCLLFTFFQITLLFNLVESVSISFPTSSWSSSLSCDWLDDLWREETLSSLPIEQSYILPKSKSKLLGLPRVNIISRSCTEHWSFRRGEQGVVWRSASSLHPWDDSRSRDFGEEGSSQPS